MMVTAVIPTTGERREFLSRALSSVQKQVRPPDRVLIVVDAVAEIASRVSREHDAEVIGGHGRHGVSVARNVGAAAAQDGFLAFLDDDDVWKPEYLREVFDEGYEFEVALTAFEKHTPTTVAPEKVPPKVLTSEAFLVANPGLRGSNLVISRGLYLALGGFDESLPAFNDLDFGVRLARVLPTYRRITKPLVEFHSHKGPRLSTPGCTANRDGLRRYLELHGSEMTEAELAAFRNRSLRLWGIDPLVSEDP